MEKLRRFLRPPDRSFFLVGPRGTGKTTWLQQTFPDALVVELLKPKDFRTLSARPERLAELVLGFPGEVEVLDEVQRAPELLNVVHDLMESGPARRFILTGSSPPCSTTVRPTRSRTESPI